MTAKKNVPELRFPEFQGEWVEKRLGDLAKLSNRKHDPAKSTANYKCVELENLIPECGVVSGYFESNTQKSTKNKFFQGDILFGKLRPYLKKYWKANFDGVCSSEIWVLRPKGISNEFLYTIVQTDRFSQLCSKSSGTKMPRADWNYVKEGTFIIPAIPEQQKIAFFFSLLDKRIEKQQEKISCLEEFKKGLMQKIFSRELRFKDENGEEYPDWEEKRFIELFKSVSVKGCQILSSEIKDDGEWEVVDQGAAEIAGYSNDGAKLFTETPVIIYGDHTTIVKYRKVPFIVGADGVKLLNSTSQDHDLRFLYYSLHFSNVAPEGYKRHFSIIKKIKLLVASLPEQQKIGQALFKVDELIDKNKELLELLKLLKKGLMQKMFV